MKTLSERLQFLIDYQKTNERAVSLASGLSSTAVRKIIQGLSLSPQATNLQKIADTLNTSPKWLLSGEGRMLNESKTESNIANIAMIDFPTLPPLPVLGEARGGDEDIWQQFTAPNQWVARPIELKDVKDAYAVNIVGDSMYPVLKSGTIACISPQLTPHKEDIVVIEVELECGSIFGLIKELVKITEHEVILKQYNPVKDITYQKSQVKTIHAVQSISLRRS